MALPAKPTITAPPAPLPTRGEDPVDFSNNINSLVQWYPSLTTNLSGSIDWIEASYDEVVSVYDLTVLERLAAVAAQQGSEDARDLSQQYRDESQSFSVDSMNFRDQSEAFRDGALSAAAAAQSGAGLPSITGKPGFVLTVNSNSDTVEWRASRKIGQIEEFPSLSDVPPNYLPMDGSIDLNSAYPDLAEVAIPVFWDVVDESPTVSNTGYIKNLDDDNFLVSRASGSTSTSVVVVGANGAIKTTLSATTNFIDDIECNPKTGTIIFTKRGVIGFFVSSLPITQSKIDNATHYTDDGGTRTFLSDLQAMTVNPESGNWVITIRNDQDGTNYRAYYSKNDGQTWSFQTSPSALLLTPIEAGIIFCGGLWYSSNSQLGLFTDQAITDDVFSVNMGDMRKYRIGGVNPENILNANITRPIAGGGFYIQPSYKHNFIPTGETRDQGGVRSSYLQYNTNRLCYFDSVSLHPGAARERRVGVDSWGNQVDFYIYDDGGSNYFRVEIVGERVFDFRSSPVSQNSVLDLNQSLSCGLVGNGSSYFYLTVDPVNPRFYLPNLNKAGKVYAVVAEG